jgi:DNA-binding response OmpR family regulator
VYTANDGEQAIEMVRLHDIDLVILDIMMPKLDGFSAIKQIKAMKDVPVIMLSARFEEHDKLLGFELGIDDYIVKPFSLKELMARIKTVLNRRNIKSNKQEVFDKMVIDYDAKTVTIDFERINLTPKEYELLVFMIEHKNQALSRDYLLNKVWNYNYYGDDRTVDTHIKMLRKNLKDHRHFIVTVRGTGYKFETEH